MNNVSSKLKNKTGTPKSKRVKVKALVVFEHDDRLLLAEYRDKHHRSPYYRPLGGTIEFGEHAEDAARREIREEIGINVATLTFVGSLENIFADEVRKGHEILLIYRGQIFDKAILTARRIPALEGEDRFWAAWVPVDDIRSGRVVCYPNGLLDLLGIAEHAFIQMR